MKKRLNLIYGGLVGVLVMAVVAQASVIDAPHNTTHGINCATCHSYSLWWQYSPTEQNPNPDHAAISDAVCVSCHSAAGSQPVALTHSSTVINSTLHETWEVGCTACHNPHHQEQLSWVGTATEPYLVSGTISTVTYNSSLDQSTIVYANATTKPNWPPSGEEEADPDWANKSLANPNRGLILVHDKAKAFNTFSIISATPTDIVVKGELKPEDIDPDYTDPETQVKNSPTCNTFGLLYGQFVKDTIAARQVRFFDPRGGFVEEGAGTTGICQACHVETAHYTNSGVLPSGSDSHIGREGGNCTTCHKHNAGFKGNGHDGTSFAWGGDCATCHDPEGSVVNISTEIHGRSCGICHLAPAGGGDRREGDSASGIDGNALGATNASTCVECHEPTAYPSGGIHHNSAGGREHALAHLNTPGITCASCHDIANIPLMADGQPLATTTTCATCHQNGAGGAPNNTNFATSWNDPDYSLSCADCHDFPPAYADSPAKANSHPRHTVYGYNCAKCHYDTTRDGISIANQSLHLNGVNDVTFADPSMNYNAAARTCSNTFCHSNGMTVEGMTPASTSVQTPALTLPRTIMANTSAAWGSGPLSCSSCHDILDQKQVYPNSDPNLSDDIEYSNNAYPDNHPDLQYKANTHGGHTFLGCNTCHYATTSDGTTITGTDKHVNGVYDLTPDPNAVSTIGYTYDAGGGSCTAVCHGTLFNYHNGGLWRWGYNTLKAGSGVYTGSNMQVTMDLSLGTNFGGIAGPYAYFIEWGDGATETVLGNGWYNDGPGAWHQYASLGSKATKVWMRDSRNHRSMSPREYTYPSLNGVCPSGSDPGTTYDNTRAVPNRTHAINGSTITITDLSVDPDYFCNRPANYAGDFGLVTINWGDGTVETFEVRLTDNPSEPQAPWGKTKTFSHSYSAPFSGTIGYGVEDNVYYRAGSSYPPMSMDLRDISIP